MLQCLLNFTEKKPELIHIQRLLLKGYGKYWKQIGRQLGIDSTILHGIEVKYATHCNKTVTCCFTTMKKWLEDDTNATWEKLINALKMAQIGEMFNSELSLTQHSLQNCIVHLLCVFHNRCCLPTSSTTTSIILHSATKYFTGYD